MKALERLIKLVQAELDNKDTLPRMGQALCYINYTIESFKSADSLVILPIVKAANIEYNNRQ